MQTGSYCAAGLFTRLRIGVIAAALGLLLPIGADARAPQAHNRQLHLSSQEVHERCVDLATGQHLNYSFKASQSVEFSIRYREGDKVAIPVSRKARSGKGQFTAAVVYSAHPLPASAMASPDQSKSADKKDAPAAAKKAGEPKKDAKSDNRK